MDPILTIAVPIYNMERWLDKNLATCQAPELSGRIEVLCLNNASQDASKEIIERWVEMCPQIFTLVDRHSRGYGGSINEALARARGRFFRIVDADDWVDTGELLRQVEALESCESDIVLTDYEVVNLQTGAMTPIRAKDKGAVYETVYRDFAVPAQTLPSIHATTYRTTLLRESGFQMQDGIFFVDEEYVILPYLSAKSVIYYPFDIYRYQVADPNQSTSPKNRGKYQVHREKVLRRLIREYQKARETQPDNSALDYCFERMKQGVGDHFTTLYMYVPDRSQGRRLARYWKNFLLAEAPDFWPLVCMKVRTLCLLNYLHISLSQYEWAKKLMRHGCLKRVRNIIKRQIKKCGYRVKSA